MDEPGRLSPTAPSPAPGTGRPEEAIKGAAAGIVAFFLWALFPVYFNQFGPGVSPWEILLHRILWADASLLCVVLVLRRWRRVTALLARPKVLLALLASALALGCNWATFIYAVTHGEILQSSLGYYINPLLNVFLGYCFLGERLQPLQRLAVATAAAGVLITLIAYGQVPWLALLLAGCFGLYGLIRKQVDVDSVTGLMVETLFLLPIAFAGLTWMHVRGLSAFPGAGPVTAMLLVGAGIITLLPLLFFALAARRLRLATLGLLQYIAPTGHFLIGVFLYGEPFTKADAVTFGCIWIGLTLYTIDLWQQHRMLHRLT